MARFPAELVAILLIAHTANAGPPSFTAGGEYVIQTWKSEDGLPEDSATAILQTPDGYLWFGTFNGLVRFNGLEFKVFHPGNTPGMPGAGIVNLHLDERGRIWVSTTSGLGVLDAGRWRTFDRNDGWPGDFVRSFAERDNGDLLLTSFDGHVAEYVEEKFATLTPPVEPGQGCFGYADEQGRWWIVQSKFTGWWDGERWTPASGVASVNGVTGCGRARDGGRWLLSGRDLIKLRNGTEISRRTVSEAVGDFWSLMEDSRENVWICSGSSGLFQVTASGETKHWTTANGLSAKSARCAFEDREGNIWIGTDNGGLQQLTRRRFRNFAAGLGVPPAVVSSVCAGPSGNIWVATFGEGLFKVEEAGTIRVPLPPDSGNQVLLQSVLEDRGGRLWLGSYGGGLTVVEDGKARVIPPDETGGRNVTALFEDSRGEIWISGGQSAASFKSGKFRSYNATHGLPRGAVTFFAEDHEGRIWAAHRDGAFRLTNGHFARVPGPKGSALKQVTCLCPDTGGAMWIGTGAGELVRWQDGKMKSVSMPTEPVQSIQGIIYDGLGWFWIATGRGMLRVAAKELNDAAESPDIAARWASLDRFDGLPVSGFSGARQPVSTQSKDRRIWFATPRGVVMTQPDGFQLNTVPPQVHIETFSHYQPASDASVERETDLLAPFNERVILPPGSRRLTFRCAAINFKSPGNVRCQMMLEGQDTTWREMTQRAATFYDLPPKAYTFRFRAANADGVWSESDARLAFTVTPRYWETLWFRGGCALLLIAAGAAVAGWITRLRHAHILETMEIHKQREEIAHLSRVAALNELSGSLAHELNQPLAIILSNTQAAQRLLRQQPLAVEELHEILTDIVAEDRRAGEVIQRLRAMLKRGESSLQPEFASAIVDDVLTLIRSDLINRGVTVETSYAPGLPPVMADRIQIQQVLLNLITNACDSMASNERHLRRLKISTTEMKGQVHLRVSDEGCGLPAGDPDQVFKAFFSTKDYGLGMGLAICRSIAHGHHGYLSAEPNAPRGTSFRLVLPAALSA